MCHHSYFRLKQVRVHDGALDVVEVGVVLERALQQSCLLAQLGDVRAVVVREHLVAQDCIRHLHTHFEVYSHCKRR